MGLEMGLPVEGRGGGGGGEREGRGAGLRSPSGSSHAPAKALAHTVALNRGARTQQVLPPPPRAASTPRSPPCLWGKGAWGTDGPSRAVGAQVPAGPLPHRPRAH